MDRLDRIVAIKHFQEKPALAKAGVDTGFSSENAATHALDYGDQPRPRAGALTICARGWTERDPAGMNAAGLASSWNRPGIWIR
jgi:hypothetical protein